MYVYTSSINFGGGTNPNLVRSTALVCLVFLNMLATVMENLHELYGEFARDILDLSEYVEAGPADPDHVACKAEEIMQGARVISALFDRDVV